VRPRYVPTVVVCCLFALFCSAQRAASAKIDPKLQALADTERAFARLGAEKGVRESFLAYFAPDGIWFVPHPKLTVTDLRSRPAPAGPPSRKLGWAPMYGDVSRAGDLGYDTGPSANSDLTPKSDPTRYSYFFSIWKKQPDGNWRVALDLGTETPDVWDPTKPPDFHAAPPSGWKPKRKPDLAKELSALQAREVEFSQLAQAEGVARTSTRFLDEHARFHRNGISPVAGRENIVAFLTKSDTRASWQPMDAFVAKSADLGYTYGRYRAPGIGAQGSEETGYYVHVWRKDVNGDWKLVFHVTSPLPEKVTANRGIFRAASPGRADTPPASCQKSRSAL
jgi:ketosteroid isomerase-like protein